MLERLHHRLVMGMGLAGLVAAWGGGVLMGPLAAVGALGLGAAAYRRPGEDHLWLDRAFLLAAVGLAVRAAYIVVVAPEARLPAMVDLLVVLLLGEAWKPAGRGNDIRLYVLSFALLLAATVFRPGLVFALSFVVYIALSTVALMVGHLRRTIDRFGSREVALGRRFLLRTAALSTVTLVISVVVFLAFPRVSRGWAPGGPSLATSIAGFADEVSLGAHGATIQSNPDVVLRVEFPDGPPEDLAGFHWRGRSYDRFDGVRWTHSEQMPRSGPGPDWYRRRWDGQRIRQEMYSSLLDSRVLFALHPAVDVDARNRIRPFQDRAGDLRFYGSLPPTYGVESVREPPSAVELRADGDGRAPAEEWYLQLTTLAPRVTALADSLTAGHETRYDKARAVENFLRSFDYTRELPATAAQTGLEYFLFQRRAGHCEYFSTAMVVLLRAAGVPARNVNGFLGGQWNTVGDHLAVTQNEAHSWVEVWYPDWGWVTHDPTPAGVAGAGAGPQAWFWPGRMLLDGLQHRWGKWVLDYSLADQEGMVRRALGLLDDDGTGPDRESRFPAWLPWSLALLALGGLAWVVVTARDPKRPETRLYLRLRRAYDGEGFDGIPRGEPLRFAAALEDSDVPGRREATALVERYLRLRYGGDDVPDPELSTMRKQLSAARRALRRA